MSDLLSRTRYRVAQHWRYRCQTPEARDTFGILAVENHPRRGVVVLAWVEHRSPFHVGPNQFVSLAPVWFTQDAVDQSVTELVEERGPLSPNFTGSTGEFAQAESWSPADEVFWTRTVGEVVEEWTARYREERDGWMSVEPVSVPEESLGLWSLIQRQAVGRLRRLIAEHPALANDPLPIDEDDEYCYGVSGEEFRDCPPLALTAYWGQKKVARLLLELGADPNRANRDGRAPLHFAGRSSGRGDQAAVVRMLCKRGADPNARDKDGRTPMTCGYCPVNVAAALHKFGVPLTLNHALWLRKVKTARGLLVDDPDAVRTAPMPDEVIDNVGDLIRARARRWHAREVGEDEVLFSLTTLTLRADGNGYEDRTEETLARWRRHAELERRAFRRYRDLLDLALARGADPNAGVALFYAVQMLDTSLAGWLMAHGADPTRDLKRGGGVHLNDPRMVRTNRMAALLERYGAKPNPYRRKREPYEVEQDEYMARLRERFG